MAAATRLNLPPLPTIRDLLRMYELGARKHLSQNFLLDMNICRKIVRRTGGLRGAYVCEVGPGPGGITRAILEENVAQLDVVEKDSRFFPFLEQLASASKNKMTIHHGDILKFEKESSELFPDSVRKSWYENPPDVHFIGNLPFNIATPLIIDVICVYSWMEAISNRTGPFSYGRTRLTLTFQKEVAERIIAPILDAQRCRLSVMCQYLCKVNYDLKISGSSFLPPPDVDVGVVHFVPLEEPAILLNFKVVEKFCRHLFHFRQKYCIRCVESLFPKSVQREFSNEILRRARVDPTVKCTAVSIEEIRDMCHVYYELCSENPGLFAYNSFQQLKLPMEEVRKLEPKFPPDYEFKIKNFERL